MDEHASGAERLAKCGTWLRNAAERLANAYFISRDEAQQALSVRILQGRSRRIAWLETCREIEREIVTPGKPSDSSDEDEGSQSRPDLAGLHGLGNGEVEMVCRRMDLEVILTPDEIKLVDKRVAGYTEQEIADAFGVCQSTVSDRLEVIRRKIEREYGFRRQGKHRKQLGRDAE
jgi:DNA-directed RNA polymerase specialized sigma24 family protein